MAKFNWEKLADAMYPVFFPEDPGDPKEHHPGDWLCYGTEGWLKGMLVGRVAESSGRFDANSEGEIPNKTLGGASFGFQSLTDAKRAVEDAAEEFDAADAG